VKNIVVNTFSNCPSLTEITLSNSLEVIEARAFRNSGLTEITLPSSLTSLHVDALNGNKALMAINVDDNNTTYKSIDGVLFSKDESNLVRFPAGRTSPYTIPETVTAFSTNAFRDTSLTTIAIPNDISSLAWGIFYDSTALTEITLASSVTYINDYAFANCTALETVVILKNGSTTTYNSTFTGCDFEKLKLWIYPANTTIPTYVVGKGIDGEDIAYGYLLDHITVDSALALNTGVSETLSVSYFATAGTDTDKDALVEKPAVIWTSSNEAVATVDETTGKVTAVGDGTATITASVDSLAGGDAITAECVVTVETPDAIITSFVIEGVQADIDRAKNITVELPAGTDLSNLAPDIVISTGAVSPTGPQNFTPDVTYVVYYVAGSAVNEYIVTVTLSPEITGFTFDSINGETVVINQEANTIAVTVPYGTDITALAPGIGHNSTAIEPISPTEPQDFSQGSVDYTVTAANGSTKTYTVTVTVASPPSTPGTPGAQTYTVTVIGGVDSTNAGPYAAGATVSITANAAPAGKVFDAWTSSDGVTFANANSATTTFVMPAKAVTVTATYKDATGSTNPPVMSGWVKDANGDWKYYVDGEAATGWVENKDKWYYLDENGVMDTGWVKDADKWYYLASPSGAMKTGWVKDADKWYYLAASGAMKTGWVKDKDKWYYLASPSGAMKTGWVKDKDKWYYLASPSGAMQTGWVKDGSTWYYLNSSGAMLTGTQKIGSKTYRFNASGAWIA
jgi:hypothetical protein